MARQNINNTPADSGLGDTLKVAMDKINAMTLELYAADSSFADEIDLINVTITKVNDGSLLNHTHTIAQIQGLQSTLNSKISASTYIGDMMAINASIQAINDALNDIVVILNSKVEEAPFSGITYGRNNGVWVEITGGTATGDYVPYTGATKNVDLGEYALKAGQFTLDITPTGTTSVGTTRWNDSLGVSETTLKGDSVVLKNGIDLVARVVNKVSPNTTLTKANYPVVRISGAQGQRLAVAYAQANNDNNSADTLGVVIETIATNQEGFIMTVGQLEGINTTGSLQGETWADGDVLYLSPTTPGKLTNIKPNGSTGHIVIIGYVEYAHINNGKIYVKIMNGWELDELHNVFISGATNNQGLFFESSTSLWKNKSIATVLGYTPANDSNVVHLTDDETIDDNKTFLGQTLLKNAQPLTIVSPDYSSGSAGALLYFLSQTGSTYTSINSRSNGGGSGGDLILQNFSNNVGIGTTTPAYKLQVDGSLGATSVSATTYYNLPIGATRKTGSTISFSGLDIYNSSSAPSSATGITQDLTSAKIGIVQKIYHQSATAPSFPAGWVKLGAGSYVNSSLNIIYAEWDISARVEYWIVQQS